MRTMYILKGLPGSGKSTIAAEMIRDEPERFVRINRDDLRFMCTANNNPYGVGRVSREELIRSFKNELIRQSLKDGYDVILDDTHLVQSTVNKLHELAEEVGDVNVIERFIDVPIDECIRRDATRKGYARVGEKVIRDMAKSCGIDRGKKLPDRQRSYPAHDATCTYDVGSKLPKAIICDLDGTLALINDRSPYDATDCDVKDKPNWPVIKCVLAMHAAGHKVIFMSGRDEKYRPETCRFIEKYCRVDNKAFYESVMETEATLPIDFVLFMRGETNPDPSKPDQRKDSIVKRELFDKHVRGKYNVTFVLDDRDQVVRLWRELGLSTFQVNYGSF